MTVLVVHVQISGITYLRMTLVKSIQEQFAEIGAQYGWEPGVIDFMTSEKGLAAREITDFTFLLDVDLQKITVSLGESCKNAMQQNSRLRQAWDGLKKAKENEDVLKRKRSDDVDLDELLTQTELESLADLFWGRYRVKLPPALAPCDALVSRVSKELSKRLLTLRDVWKTRSLSQQQRSSHKRMRIADGFDLVQNEDEDPVDNVQSPQKYLDLLQTLFLAYVIAGTTKVKIAPANETRITDPLTVVEVPWDVLIRVHHRATVQVRKVPFAMQLGWLEARMDGEREAWIEEFRNSDRTLGQVIAHVYTSREAVWAVDELKFMAPMGLSPVKKLQDRQDSGQKDKRQQTVPPTKAKGAGPAANLASALRDGNKLCANYNRGACGNKKDNCKHGRHFCSGTQANGRVCGGRHPASACTNPKVPKRS